MNIQIPNYLLMGELLYSNSEASKRIYHQIKTNKQKR